MDVELLPKTGTFADWMVVEAIRRKAVMDPLRLDPDRSRNHIDRFGYQC